MRAPRNSIQPQSPSIQQHQQQHSVMIEQFNRNPLSIGPPTPSCSLSGKGGSDGCSHRSGSSGSVPNASHYNNMGGVGGGMPAPPNPALNNNSQSLFPNTISSGMSYAGGSVPPASPAHSTTGSTSRPASHQPFGGAMGVCNSTTNGPSTTVQSTNKQVAGGGGSLSSSASSSSFGQQASGMVDTTDSGSAVSDMPIRNSVIKQEYSCEATTSPECGASSTNTNVFIPPPPPLMSSVANPSTTVANENVACSLIPQSSSKDATLERQQQSIPAGTAFSSLPLQEMAQMSALLGNGESMPLHSVRSSSASSHTSLPPLPPCGSKPPLSNGAMSDINPSMHQTRPSRACGNGPLPTSSPLPISSTAPSSFNPHSPTFSQQPPSLSSLNSAVCSQPLPPGSLSDNSMPPPPPPYGANQISNNSIGGGGMTLKTFDAGADNSGMLNGFASPLSTLPSGGTSVTSSSQPHQNDLQQQYPPQSNTCGLPVMLPMSTASAGTVPPHLLPYSNGYRFPPLSSAGPLSMEGSKSINQQEHGNSSGAQMYFASNSSLPPPNLMPSANVQLQQPLQFSRMPRPVSSSPSVAVSPPVSSRAPNFALFGPPLASTHPYMSLPKPLFVFDTNMANDASHQVQQGNFPTIIHFHENLDRTRATLRTYYESLTRRSGSLPPPPFPGMHGMPRGRLLRPHGGAGGVLPNMPPFGGPLPPQVMIRPGDESLSPQQRQAREMKLNRLDELNQRLLPETAAGGEQQQRQPQQQQSPGMPPLPPYSSAAGGSLLPPQLLSPHHHLQNFPPPGHPHHLASFMPLFGPPISSQHNEAAQKWAHMQHEFYMERAKKPLSQQQQTAAGGGAGGTAAPTSTKSSKSPSNKPYSRSAPHSHYHGQQIKQEHQHLEPQLFPVPSPQPISQYLEREELPIIRVPNPAVMRGLAPPQQQLPQRRTPSVASSTPGGGISAPSPLPPVTGVEGGGCMQFQPPPGAMQRFGPPPASHQQQPGGMRASISPLMMGDPNDPSSMALSGLPRGPLPPHLMQRMPPMFDPRLGPPPPGTMSPGMPPYNPRMFMPPNTNNQSPFPPPTMPLHFQNNGGPMPPSSSQNDTMNLNSMLSLQNNLNSNNNNNNINLNNSNQHFQQQQQQQRFPNAAPVSQSNYSVPQYYEGGPNICIQATSSNTIQYRPAKPPSKRQPQQVNLDFLQHVHTTPPTSSTPQANNNNNNNMLQMQQQQQQQQRQFTSPSMQLNVGGVHPEFSNGPFRNDPPMPPHLLSGLPPPGSVGMPPLDISRGGPPMHIHGGPYDLGGGGLGLPPYPGGPGDFEGMPPFPDATLNGQPLLFFPTSQQNEMNGGTMPPPPPNSQSGTSFMSQQQFFDQQVQNGTLVYTSAASTHQQQMPPFSMADSSNCLPPGLNFVGGQLPPGGGSSDNVLGAPPPNSGGLMPPNAGALLAGSVMSPPSSNASYAEQQQQQQMQQQHQQQQQQQQFASPSLMVGGMRSDYGGNPNGPGGPPPSQFLNKHMQYLPMHQHQGQSGMMPFNELFNNPGGGGPEQNLGGMPPMPPGMGMMQSNPNGGPPPPPHYMQQPPPQQHHHGMPPQNMSTAPMHMS